MRKKICIGVVLAGISAGALSGITSNLAHALPPVSVSVSEYDIYPHGTWALAPGADTGQYNFTTAQHFTGNGSLHIGVLEGQHEWLNDYAYGCVEIGRAHV